MESGQTIEPFFRRLHLSLAQIETRHIQQFYSEKLKTVSPNSVIHYHAVICQALKYAMKTDLVTQNVAMKVDRPKNNDFQPVFLDASQLANPSLSRTKNRRVFHTSQLRVIQDRGSAFPCLTEWIAGTRISKGQGTAAVLCLFAVCNSENQSFFEKHLDTVSGSWYNLNDDTLSE